MIGEQLLLVGLVLIAQRIVKEYILIAYHLDIQKEQKILKRKNGKKNLTLIKSCRRDIELNKLLNLKP